MPAAPTSLPVLQPANVVRRRVRNVEPDASSVTCRFSDQDSLKLNRFLARFIYPGDEIEFHPTAPLPLREARVVQQRSQRSTELYLGSIGYASQPKTDKRGEYFLQAEVTESRLGLKQI